MLPANLFMGGKAAAVAQNPSLSKLSKVERARQRLDSAVGRLEAVAEAAADGDAPAADDEFQKLRDENARLRAVNETATARLDSAIGRIKAAIGE